MESICQQLIQHLDKFAKSQEVCRIGHLFGRMTLDMLFTIGFDCSFDFLQEKQMYEELNNAIQLYFKVSWIASLPFFHILRKMKVPIKAYQQYNHAIEVIQRYQEVLLMKIKMKYKNQTLSKYSFSQVLMNFATEHHLTDEEILSELFVFIIAGKQ